MAIICAVKYRMKPGTRDQLMEIAKINMEKTRQEKGNLSYTHYPSMENDQDMFVFELWETREDVERHCKAPHYLEFARKRLPMMESYEFKTFQAELLREGDKIATW